METQDQEKPSQKASPKIESRRPPWHDVERFAKPQPELRILPKKPGIPLLTLAKRLWFPILLLPMTAIIILRIQQQPTTPRFPLPFPTTNTPTPIPSPTPLPARNGEKIPNDTVRNDGCVIGGCSGEICADEERFSTCILRPESVCYKTAVCERQSDGSCGWTRTPELLSCLEEYQAQQ